MSLGLPDRVDPWHWCAQGKVLQGRLALQECKRLVPLLASAAGEAAFTLEFLKDAEQRAIIRGEVEANLPLICQRCLEAMSYPVAETFELAVVGSLDEANRLPEHLEPVLLEDAWLEPRTVLEDELILVLPTTPRHAEADCAVRMNEKVTASSQRDDAAKRANPFAVLSILKQGDKQGKT